MLAGLGDGHAHGDLGEAAVGLVAELDLLTDGEAGVVSQSRLVLGGGRIPLEDAGVLAVDPFLRLIDGVEAGSDHGRTGGDNVVVLEGVDEVQAVNDLFLAVLALVVLDPGLAVLGLEVEGHQDHAVILTDGQRIVIIAQLLLEGLAGGNQIIIRGGNRLDAGLLEGVHVPVEDTAGHRDGHCLQAVGNDAGVLGGIAPLAQVDDVAVLAQIDELLARGAVLVQPVPVDLHDVRTLIGSQRGGLLLLPAGPCAVGGGNGDVGVLLVESFQSLLVSLMAGVTAPPADGQFNGIGGVDLVGLAGSGFGSSSRLGSGAVRSACGLAGSSGAAGCRAAASQQSGGHGGGNTERDCLFHVFVLLKLLCDLFLQTVVCGIPYHTICCSLVYMITNRSQKINSFFGSLRQGNVQFLPCWL